MYGLAIYSLKVGVCLAVFYLFFKLLLSRETLHRFNRIVVLGAMSLSFVLPLCVITITHELPVVPEPLFADIQVAAADNTAAPADEPFAWERLLGALYLAGASVMLAATAVSVRRVMRLVRSGRHETLDCGITLVRLPQPVTPFSWWRYVVISEADYAACGREIITHETAHLRLHHSWDLLATDLAGCLQWFNPAMWLLRRELRAIHEYEADEAVLDSGVDARQYQLILIKKAAGGRWYSVANSFNHSKLKNRITMMLQKRSSRWAGAKALFVVPLAGLALGAFAETVYVLPQDKGMQEIAEMQISEQPDSSGMSVSVDKNRRQVIIRGAGDKTVTGEPLCLVDGKEVDDLNSVPTNRIARVEVLKDESAAKYVEQYGDKVNSGVVLITLKKEGEPDNVAPADAKKVVVGSGSFPKPEEWQAQQQKFAEMDAYFQSDEWKAKEKELAKMDEYFRSDVWKAQQRKFAEMDAYFQSEEWKAQERKLKEADAYFQSDEWKAVEKKLAKVGKYFQSDEWKAKQKRLNTAFRVGTATPSGARIYIIDGRKSNEAEVKALAPNDIASINISTDKQADGSVVSTVFVVTKRQVKVDAEAGRIVRQALACEGGPLDISTAGTTRIYSGKFRFTSLKNLPQGATILLDGKEVSRQQLIGKKLRLARFHMGADAAERGNAAGVLYCVRK